jgi:hypothetical protein
MAEAADASLTALADAAFRQAAAKVIRRAKETGTPLIIWERNEIRSIPPDAWPGDSLAGPSSPNLPEPK